MTLVLELPADVEARLSAAAVREGVPVEEYALKLLGDVPDAEDDLPKTPAETVEWWKKHGLLGIWSDRTDLPDSPEFARQLRRQAEHREW